MADPIHIFLGTNERKIVQNKNRIIIVFLSNVDYKTLFGNFMNRLQLFLKRCLKYIKFSNNYKC